MTLNNFTDQQLERELKDRRKSKRKARARPKRVIQSRTTPTAKGQRQPRAEDPGYLSWLHQGLPCVACRATYVHLVTPSNPIEAAHQKFNLSRPGWVKFTGKRVHDRQCLPLCRWHHQDAPNACDKAQAKFWERMGFALETVADLCAALYAAYQRGAESAEGTDIIAEFARKGEA